MDRLKNRKELLYIIRKELINKSQFPICAEIGVLSGEYAKEIYNILPIAKLYLIDKWNEKIEHYTFINGSRIKITGKQAIKLTTQKFSKQIQSGKVQLLRGDSISQLETLPDKHLDFSYLDADHRFQFVLNDLEMLYCKTKPGGWICGHDYCEICDFGVVRAVAVFCYKFGLNIKYLTDEKPISIIKKKPRPNFPGKIAFNSFAIQI